MSYGVAGNQGIDSVYYCQVENKDTKAVYGDTKPTNPNTGGSMEYVTLTVHADPFGVRKLTEVDTVNLLTLMGIFAGYFRWATRPDPCNPWHFPTPPLSWQLRHHVFYDVPRHRQA